MLTIRPQSRIVSKILRKKSGEFVRAYFLISEIEGKYFVKLLKTEAIASDNFRTSEETLLPGNTVGDSAVEFVKSLGREIVSPYFDLNFFISQLTRAPSF